MHASKSPYPIPTFEQATAIPRVIHQTYPIKKLPAELNDNISRMMALNPSYRHMLYDDEYITHFIEREYGSRILSMYNLINPEYGAARADLFRYLLMYKDGGIYLDIKSRIVKPLDA